MDHLDSEYREKAGLRIDQLATAEEIQNVFRTCRTWYQAEEVFHTRGIYVFLYINMNLWLGGKAYDALDSRRQKAERTAS